MNTLSPAAVHQLSSISYETDQIFRKASTQMSHSGFKVIRNRANENFTKMVKKQCERVNITQIDMLTANSGLFQVNQLSGFGFVAEGFAGNTGELVLVTRGTNFEHNKFDLATDANVGFGVGPRGNIVHRGFLNTFKGYQNQLINLITNEGQRRHVGTIHCIGHSLGGALANLNALALYSAGYSVKLYTIGSPRVGIVSFAQDLTRALPEDRIIRVYNACDPVPMVPVFPFLHGSRRASEFIVNTNDKIAIEQHLLSAGYAPMARIDSWSSLKKTGHATSTTHENLLQQLNQLGGGAMFSGRALALIIQAHMELLKLRGIALTSIAQTALGCAMTIFDLIAENLINSIQGPKIIAEHAMSIVQAILEFLGIGFNRIKELTSANVQWVIHAFSKEMSSRSQLAMQRALHAA